MSECPSLECVPPVDINFSLQGFPAVPPPAPVPGPPAPFGNAPVQFCCPGGQTMAFTGTLPGWISLDTNTNCLIGAAGVYRSDTPANATALAQAALNDFANAALASGDLTCSSVPACIPPAFARLSFSGTLTNASQISTIVLGGGNHYMQRFTFNATAGVSVAIWEHSLQFGPYVVLIDPNNNVVAQDNWSNGYGPDVINAAGITYTPLLTGVYTVECTTSLANRFGFFELVISDGVEKIIGGEASAWVSIYVASTKRIFTLRGFDKVPTANKAFSTVIDSVAQTIIADVQLVDVGASATAPGRPTLFYNPNDNSVWMGTCDNNLAFGHFFRLNPSTGAILEDIILADLPAYFGAFVPSVNKVFGAGNDGNTTTNHLTVYDCAGRAYGPTISLGGVVDVPTCKYIADIDRVLVFDTNAGTYWLVNPHDNTIVQYTTEIDYAGFFSGGFYYTKQLNAPRNFRKVDLLADTVVNQVGMGYDSAAIGLNECTNRLEIGVTNGGNPAPFIVGGNDLAFTATESVIAVIMSPVALTTKWAHFVWNPDASRLYYFFPDGNCYVLS